jgi:hypothetical protein
VVGEDEVDRLALLAHPIGEQDLADLHVDPDEKTTDLGIGVALHRSACPSTGW